jgi:uncharacterized protein YprB with RNaseH-like and TPR domain
MVGRAIHEEAHILVRSANRTTRNTLIALMRKNLQHLRSKNGVFEQFREYPREYSLNLDELGIYPEFDTGQVPETTLFIDYEATNLRNRGSHIITDTEGRIENGHFRETLLLARTPFEEAALIKRRIRSLDEFDTIAAYNASFDIGLLEERAFANMIPQPGPDRGKHPNLLGDPPNYELERYKVNKKIIDYYHDFYGRVARAKGFPKSKLATFERSELKIIRRNDVSGENIPKEYLNYILGDDSDSLFRIMAHNFMDVGTMVFMELYRQGHRFPNLKTREVSLNDFRHIFEKNQQA